MRDTARGPKPPTNPTTEHQMSRQGLARIDQKCQFWVKFGRFWAKILIFTGEKVLVQRPRHLVFWSGIGQKGPKMPIFGPK